MSDSESTISNANGTVIIQPPVVEVAEVNALESSTVSTIAENDYTTLIETSRVELISIAQPQNDTLTLIQEEGQQTVIETKQVEIIEIEVPCCDDDLKNPQFTYDDSNDALIRIDYDDESFKVLTYLSSGQLDTLLFSTNGISTLKSFIYDNRERLTQIVETQV